MTVKKEIPLHIQVEKIAQRQKLSTKETIVWMDMVKLAYTQGVNSATKLLTEKII